ncbi:NADPH oxidase organizer 1-like [Leuresthes tenuis]|uniref:NADPH oxidase organizer 1-like n=1 Tax=Leuresthes tenuis TaxID=355514 RepID=UPI003B514E8B
MTADQRFLISARIVGGVRRDKPKLKMFMVSVLWSDESELIIYRSFQDFKQFHRQLKNKFPNLNPSKKSDRVIPKFSGMARSSSIKQKGSKKLVRQMKFLESYCDKLLKCNQTVTQSTDILRFFAPKDHDLQPDFTRNTVMILMSDDLPEAGGVEGSARQHAGIVTHPFVTQTYRCVEAYETKDTKNRPFKVTVDEKLDVLIKDPAGWWLVENEAKRLAWFPAPYLELLDGEDDEEAGLLEGALYCAVRNYSSKKDDEVSVPLGSVVEVLRKSDDGWWFIRFNGRAGYIPSMYLQPYNNPRTGLYGLHRKMHSSSLNLATNRNSQASYTPRINEENRHGRLHKARSLDVLSEPWVQTQTGTDASTSDHTRVMSRTSTESVFSDLSSSSDSSSGLREEAQSNTGYPVAPYLPDGSDSSLDWSLSDRRSSNTSSEISGSNRSNSSETASVTPRVPPRPKTEEILTRCTTMTRKAALATKTRLHIQPESIHGR